MKILVTGFEPFGGETINPAFDAVAKIPSEVAGAEIVKVTLPVVYKECADVLRPAILEHKPDAVLCVGQAGGRFDISVEKVAINLGEARIPDNAGNSPSDEKLVEDGKNAYFASIPVKAIVKNIQDKGIPAHISYTAGTFVCNDIMYRLLHMIETEFQNIRGGFIHVPFDTVQVVNKPATTPSMPTNTISEALVAALEAIVNNKEDISAKGGETH